MRLHNIVVSGILLILPIIDFAVTAPVLGREKLQARVDVAHIPEDAMTVLRKRGDELDELWIKLFGHSESHFSPKPEELPTTHSPLTLPKSEPANGPIDVEQPLPSIPEEPPQVPSPDRAPPSLGDERNKMWRDPIESHFPVKQEESSAARPSSSSLPPGPAHGWTEFKKPLPSISEEPSPMSSPDHAPPNPTESGYELIKGDVPHWPSGPASLTMSSADHGLMGAHALPDPGLSTEWDHEMMDVPQSIPVSSTKHDLQPIDAESPSGKRIKTDKKTAGVR
jgi:hypothetical protein